MQVSLTTRPYNNNINILYDIWKALPFKKRVKSTDFKLLAKTVSIDDDALEEREREGGVDEQWKSLQNLWREIV